MVSRRIAGTIIGNRSFTLREKTKMADDEKGTPIGAVQDDRLAKAWTAAVERTELPKGTVAKAPLFGFNICVKIPDVFSAAFDTVKAGGAVLAAIAFPAAWPATVPVAAWESYCAARAVFSALIEKMEPLEYVTVVILGTHREGIEETDLAKEVEAFVKDPKTRTFSWHLGMSEEKVDDASADIGRGWITRVVKKLDTKKFLEIREGKLYPKSKNVDWDFGF